MADAQNGAQGQAEAPKDSAGGTAEAPNAAIPPATPPSNEKRGDVDVGDMIEALDAAMPAAPAAPAAQAGAPTGGTSAFPAALLKNRYQVFPGMPLPELDSPSAKAYAVEDRREPGRQLFALLCTPGLPVRSGVMQALKNQQIPNLIPLVDQGAAFWAPLDQHCMIAIFERPMGGRLVDAFSDGVVKINEYELGKHIIEPLTHALSELATLNIAHRALRVDNLFFMDKERRELTLGECITAPPGFDQPIIYEPIERALAMPSGRGFGDIEDDLYAMGIASTFLLLGYNPTAKMSEDEMLAAKIEHGSYQCLCGEERIPLALIEPLRGLMSDTPKERWNLESVDMWVNGQKKTPMQRKPAPKPKTAFKFAGRDHRSTRTIARDFSKNVPEAAKIIKSGKLEQWLKSSLMAVGMADAIATLVTVVKVNEGNPDGSDDVLVAKAAMHLDPEGPISFKGFSFLPDGFGVALAVEYMRKGNFQLPSEVLARELVPFWIKAQPVYHPDLSTTETTFNSLKGFFKTNELGYGIERCLYELNRLLPCQSDILVKEYVDHIEDILPALDEVSSRIDTKVRPIDRHIAAYIATHFKFDTIPHLRALSDPREETSLIGLLSLFALMQWRLKGESLYGLSSWLGGLLAPAIGTYHSRTTRRSIETEIPALVRQGSLPELFDLIDNAQRRKVDGEDFEDSQVEFAHAEEEIQKIVGADVDQQQLALQTGERVTAMFAVMLSMFACTMILMMQSM